MTRAENEAYVRRFFEQARPNNEAIAARLTDDPGAILKEAETIFEAMLPDMAYMDNPAAPMASSVFGCAVTLAAWQALQPRGVDVHDFGKAYLEDLAAMPQRPRPTAPPGAEAEAQTPIQQVEAFIAAGEASKAGAGEGEFVFEAYFGDKETNERGMNIKSCAICHAFGNVGAMDLVPYMCASDDVVSDRDGQGLKRTGSIAVGADECDFVYRRGGEPQRLAKLYPDKIHFPHKD